MKECIGTRIKDLIALKDYDYISIRCTLPEKTGNGDTFIGCAKSVRGHLISLDGDSYDENEFVLSYTEWNKPDKDIKNGLTILLDGEWYD